MCVCVLIYKMDTIPKTLWLQLHQMPSSGKSRDRKQMSGCLGLGVMATRGW